DSARRALVALACTLTALTLYGFAQQWGGLQHAYWHNSLFASRFVNSSHFGACAGVGTLLAAGLCMAIRPLAGRFAMALMVPVNLTGVILTDSRAVWLALAVVTPLMLLATAGVRPRASLQPGPEGTRGMAKVFLRRVAALILFCGILISVLQVDSVRIRVADLVSGRASGIGQRTSLWRQALSMIEHCPFGVGQSCFGERYLQFKDIPDRFHALRPHNDVLQITVEIGWLALPILLILLVQAMRYMWRINRSCSEVWSRVLVAACLASVWAVVLQGLVDFPLRLKGIAMLMSMITGCCIAISSPAHAPSERSRGEGLTMLVMKLGCLMVMLACGAVSASHYYMVQAEAQLAKFALSEAELAFNRAVAIAPFDPAVRFKRARLELIKMRGQQGEARRETLAAALTDLERACAVAAYRAPYHAKLAEARRIAGDLEGAALAFQAAVRCDPQLGRWRYGLAEIFLEQKKYLAAAGEYRRAFEVFHDDPIMSYNKVMQRLMKASGDPEIVMAAASSDKRVQAQMKKIIEGHRRLE
ncbi:MAG: O-antigen ligase family protein, partial [Verrucomicrobia bacterium]|nr:O-antigen ligase family protein [Verrucomicrobiota bacterium]